MPRLDANGVPILDISAEAAEELDNAQQEYGDSPDDSLLLTGERVYVHNPAPRDLPTPSVTTFVVGGETLSEAAKSVVGALAFYHATQVPDWVASTHDGLARIVAEHWSTPDHEVEVRPVDKAVT